LPHVQLPAEELTGPLVSLPVIGDIPLTNTLVAVALGDVVLLLIAFAVNRAIRRGELVPKGIVGAVEAILEGLYQLAQTTAGKWAKSIFPWMATIVLVVLMANWLELLPGVDSIGLFDAHHIEHPEECEFTTLFTIGSMEAIAVGGESECASGVVPFVRVASTDLNFTLALALITVFMTQVFGVRALGISYFTKFINVKPLFSKPFFGAIDFAVGLLELVSETSRVISFSFRLFGNIFAGSILLFVIGSLVPVFAQTMFLILEFFVGLIQAIVFGMLAMIFMAQATVGHGDEEH
jgi:F-type H+-transporting ATPase subunit a